MTSLQLDDLQALIHKGVSFDYGPPELRALGVAYKQKERKKKRAEPRIRGVSFFKLLLVLAFVFLVIAGFIAVNFGFIAGNYVVLLIGTYYGFIICFVLLLIAGLFTQNVEGRPRFIAIFVSIGILAVLALSIVPNRHLLTDTTIFVLIGFSLGFLVCSAFVMIIRAIRRRQSSVADPRLFFKMTIGIESGLLWIYRNDALSLMSQNAFTNVEFTVDHIVAFINETQAHVFSRPALETSEAGQAVLTWLRAISPEGTRG